MAEYYLKGKTFSIKEDLKAHGCVWVPDKKMWKTPYLDREELSYKILKSECYAFDVEMIPVKLTDECKKIQDILNNEKTKI